MIFILIIWYKTNRLLNLTSKMYHLEKEEEQKAFFEELELVLNKFDNPTPRED